MIVEALAAGTKVVSTDCASGPGSISGPRSILKDGALGYLAATNDERNFCQQILHAYQNPIRKDLLVERAKDYSIQVIGRNMKV